MINVLVGAAVGGVLNVVAYAVIQKIRHKPITWRAATASFVGGAVGGALCGATFGASLLEAGGMKALGMVALDGGASSAAETATDNLLEHKPVLRGVARDAAIGAVEAPVLYLGTRGLAKLLPVPALPGLEGVDAKAVAEASDPVTVLAREGIRDARKAAGAVLADVVSTGERARLANAVSSATSSAVNDTIENMAGYVIPAPGGDSPDSSFPDAGHGDDDRAGTPDSPVPALPAPTAFDATRVAPTPGMVHALGKIGE